MRERGKEESETLVFMEISDTMQHELPMKPNDKSGVPLFMYMYVEDMNKAFGCDTTSNETYSQPYN